MAVTPLPQIVGPGGEDATPGPWRTEGTQMDFWGWLFGEGGQGLGVLPARSPSEIDYYRSGKASASEIANALRLAWEAISALPGGSAEADAPKYQFWKGLRDIGAIDAGGDSWQWYVTGADSAAFENAFAVASTTLAGNTALNQASLSFTSTTVEPAGGAPGTDVGGDVTISPGAPPEESKTEEGVGATDSLKILTSSGMRWYFDRSSGLWYVAYKLPNSERFAIFEAMPDQMDALFGAGMRPVGYTAIGGLDELIGQGNFHFSGSILEVEGTGSFEAEVQQTLARALDAGLLPAWAQGDPAIFDILYVAQAEGWSPEKIALEISELSSFKQRFKGIENFTKLDMSITESVAGYLEYERGLLQIMKRLGIQDQFNQDVMAQLLTKGHSLEDVGFVFDIFQRLEEHQASLAAFNEILVAQGRDPLGPEDQFDFLEGTASPELYELWEQSTILEIGEAAGLGQYISPQEAIELAKRTPGLTSAGDAFEALQTAAARLLQFRTELDLGSYGLDAEDLIDMSLGLAPRSGRSQAEIGMAMNRAVRAAQGFLEEQAKPFFSFQGGRPQAASLEALQPTSA